MTPRVEHAPRDADMTRKGGSLALPACALHDRAGRDETRTAIASAIPRRPKALRETLRFTATVARG